MIKRSALLLCLVILPLSAAQAKDESWFGNSKQWAQKLWQNDEKNWLERINSAVLNHNYAGVIVIAQGSNIESLAVEHKMLNGKETLRLKTLSGLPRELLKTMPCLSSINVHLQVREIKQHSVNSLGRGITKIIALSWLKLAGLLAEIHK